MRERRWATKEEVAQLRQEVEQRMSEQQASIDALTAAVAGVSTDLTAAQANIQTEITALQTANPGLDLSGLTTAVAALQGVQSSVDSLETQTPVVPPPAP